MISPLTIDTLPIDQLVPYARNARTHSDKQVAQIARSIHRFGFINPIIVDKAGMVIAGHGRVLAAKQLGLAVVPVIQVDHLSEAEKRAYILADNKIAENAGWDPDLLRVELEYLTQIDIDVDVDLTGFSMPEIDLILAPHDADEDSDDGVDTLPPLPEAGTAVSRLGDLWQLGPHRVLCGDCRDPSVVEQLMGKHQARMVITDPPYNVPIEGHVCGKGKHQHAEFAMASGELSSDEFSRFLRESLTQLAAVSLDGAVHYLFMDWRHTKELMAAAEAVYDSQLNLCVWSKTNGGMGSFYRSQHELVFVFKKGQAPHVNHVELGRHGRYRTNVWTYRGINSFGKERDALLAQHPTVKPVGLIADAILDASHRGEGVLDGFLGSGTTVLAAERVGRRAYGLEIDPRYVDVTLQRWLAVTGEMPIHVPSGLRFDEFADERLHNIDKEAVR